MTAQRTAVVVGGGLAGLAAAVRLAHRGWRVTVCEQDRQPGGKMNTRTEGRFRFDTGPSLITMPWVFEETFAAAGGRLADHADLVRVHPLARYVFDDGTRFTYTTDMPEWNETLRQLDPRDVDGFARLMALGARIYELSKATFLRRPPTAPPDWEGLKALRHMPLRHGWGNYHTTVEAHVRSPYLRQFFDRYPTYVGSSPYLSPATLLVIPYIEYAFGGWYVRGGLYRIVEGLLALARAAGVDLRTQTPVEAIERNNGRVSGVRLRSGENIAAGVVVVNADASALPALLGEHQPDPLPPADRSMSGFVMLRGTRRALPDLHHHTVFFSRDYRNEFADLFERRRFPEDPTVYISAPSRIDRSLVDGEGDALFVMANAPADADPAWAGERAHQARRAVLERLRKGGAALGDADCEVEQLWTPLDFAERYSMPGGAIYGSHSHGWRRAFLRPSIRYPRIRGLYRTGGSSHPGGGTPTVLLSAKMTCELIENDEAS